MAVDLYLYDSLMNLRDVALNGVSVLRHDERDFMLTAELLSSYGVISGEYLGFTCVDGRYRLFRVDKAEDDVSAGTTIATATEAAVTELTNSIVKEVRFDSADAATAARAALEGSGFVLGKAAAGRSGPIQKYYAKRWKALREIESVCNVRIIPYYETVGGRITRRVVDIEEKAYRRTGRILQKETDATNIQITTSGCAIARMYGVGKSIGTEDPPTCVTIADAVWSKASGDPIDKPAGQAYIEDEALAALGVKDEDVYENRNIEDPTELLKETYKAFLEARRPKVSGVATAFDVAHLPGYEHKTVALYDLLDVPKKGGGTVEGKVIDVQRDYIRPEETQIVLGEEKDASKSIARQVASLKSDTDKLGKSSGAAASRYIETKQLIQLNADTIQMNARLIDANAEEIALNATKLDEATGRLSDAELTLYGDGTSANAGLAARVYANEEKTDLISESFAQFEADTEGAIAQIGARFDGVEGELTAQSEALVTLRADADSAVASLSARVDDNEASITATATSLGSRIDLKADKTYVDTLVAEEIEAEIADLKLSYADYIETTALSTTSLGANHISTNSLALGGSNVSKTTLPIVTSFTQALGESAQAVEYTLLTCA